MEETTQYKHLGIHLNKFMTCDSNIKEASNKLRGTMLGLVNCGIHEHGLNPTTSKRLYKSIVLPKALYGCELWDDLLPKHLAELEKSHRFCSKLMQSLPRSTSTDVANLLIGLNSIEVEIDYRKLIFFWAIMQFVLPLHN